MLRRQCETGSWRLSPPRVNNFPNGGAKKMAKSTANKKKKEETINGVTMSKVHLAHVTQVALQQGVLTEGQAVTTPPQVIVAKLSEHFSKLPLEELGDCDNCNGKSPIPPSPQALDRCAFCGFDEEGNPLPEPEKPKAPLAVVPLAPAAKVDDLQTSSSLITEAVLNEQVAEVQRLKVAGAAAYWQLGRSIAIIYESQSWRQRNDKDGKPKYKNWEGFCDIELGMSPPNAYAAMDVATKFTPEQVALYGAKKLSFIVTMPESEHQAMLEETKEDSTRGTADKVRKRIKEKGYVRPPRAPAGHKPRGGARPGAGRTAEKVTIANIVGKQTVKAYKMPSTRSWDPKDLVRAKKIGDVPFCERQLLNGVTERITLLDDDQGLKFLIEIKQDKE
jgi:hypothetical protein